MFADCGIIDQVETGLGSLRSEAVAVGAVLILERRVSPELRVGCQIRFVMTELESRAVRPWLVIAREIFFHFIINAATAI